MASSNLANPLQEALSDSSVVLALEEEKEPKRKRLEEALVRELWGQNSAGFFHRTRFGTNSFLDNYFGRCALVDTEELKLRVHQDVVDIVSFVRQNSHIPRAELVRKILDEAPSWLGYSWNAAEVAIELALADGERGGLE